MQPNRQVNHKVLERTNRIRATVLEYIGNTRTRETTEYGYVVNGRLRRHGNSETEFAGRMGEPTDQLSFLPDKPQVDQNGRPFCAIQRTNSIIVLAYWKKHDGLHDRRHQEHR